MIGFLKNIFLKSKSKKIITTTTKSEYSESAERLSAMTDEERLLLEMPTDTEKEFYLEAKKQNSNWTESDHNKAWTVLAVERYKALRRVICCHLLCSPLKLAP